MTKEIPFIESLPSHWDVIPNRYLFYPDGKKVGSESANYQLLSLTTSGVKERNINVGGGKVPASYDNYQTVKKGQMVFCLFDLDCSAVFSGISNYNGMITSAYDVFSTSDRIDSRYADYWFKYVFSNRYYKMYSKNIRYTVTTDMFQSLKTPVPPLAEQRRISDFLSQKESKVDALISNVQAQIEKLKAYKQSLITEVVTKGLDPNVPMKDSGVEGIGEIPVSWGIAKLQYCAKIRSGITLGKKYPDGAELIERPYLRVANVQNGGVVLDDLKTIEVSAEEDAQYRLSAGEVLMTEGGDRDKLGRGCVWLGQVEPCLHQNHIFALRTNKLLNPYFLSYVTTSKIGRVYFDITAIKTTNLACTNSSKVLAFKLPLPSAGEQQQMVDYLDRQVDKIDKLISSKQSKIEKLEQYKRSLIYEYVTGKKEVS